MSLKDAKPKGYTPRNKVWSPAGLTGASPRGRQIAGDSQEARVLADEIYESIGL